MTAPEQQLSGRVAVVTAPWGEQPPRYATWYEPFDDPRTIAAAVTWVLDGHPEVTGIATAGETRLLGRLLEAEASRAALGVPDADALLSPLPAADYASVFAA